MNRPKATRTISNENVSSCISMAWAFERLNELKVFITPQSFTGSNNSATVYQTHLKRATFQKSENKGVLQTFVGSKKTLIWLWTAVNHFAPGILAPVLGDRSAETFKPLWQIVHCWHSYFYVTDGYKVYQSFINDADHIVDKTYMTRVESENTRLRHYLARLHRKTLCYSKSVNMLKYSIRLLLHYLKYQTLPMRG